MSVESLPVVGRPANPPPCHARSPSKSTSATRCSAPRILATSENIWVTTSGNFFDQALITAVLTVGADHILFASDYPYEMATDAARWIERAPISEGDRRKICYTNAAGLLRLPR